MNATTKTLLSCATAADLAVKAAEEALKVAKVLRNRATLNYRRAMLTSGYAKMGS